MKYIVQISRVFVGVLFIISGFIKLNDPLGFSYKLQEYFSTDVLNIPFLEPYALAISVFVVVLEVVLGVFLLIGYRRKLTIWLLLGMIVFFTFLTFYSAYFDKVKDCGCFGDALKLTPWESFTKDVILLVLILILVLGIKHIKPIFKKLPNAIVALLSFIISLWFGYHVLMHLPAIDFRAYKIGNNLSDEMAVPEDAAKPVIEYTWTFNVNGEEKEYVTNGSYPTVDGEYVGVETKTIDEGYIPSIQDFSIESDDEDLTTHFLGIDNLVIVAMYNIYNSEQDGLQKLKAFTDDAIRKGYTVIGLSASGDDAKQQLKADYDLNFDTYLCDEKVVKTIVRANPGIVVLNKGTVLNKAHWNDIEDVELQELPNALPNLKFNLKRQLDSVLVEDQRYRSNMSMETWKMQMEIDSSNLKFIKAIIDKNGYPGKSLVGEPTNTSAWYVIQHSNSIEEYLPVIKEAAANGELPKRLAAMMEDRYLMERGEAQIYGTQGSSYGLNSDNPISFMWPIKDLENVNKLRKEAGFLDTVEENAKRIFGDDFEFRNYTIEEVNKIIASYK
ncbi:MAG: DoxX family membrane protein [Winogradskyella sp.]|uniref:BT_3928 family protein n=1 Tax=Winogradskyella sp. TaxID=1883156 RepID=UPI000F41A81A|nr:BT_3928 family protein [Winogradskyella sp.]RNC86695.1 MAG: DoxX family membrane protein [Winogradskyella sp.]